MLRDETPTDHRGHRQRVCIDGRWHLLVDRATLVSLAWPTHDIHMPDTASGWATLHIGPVRWASWITGGRDS